MADPNATRRLCPNGHVLDPAWTVCPYCPSERKTVAEVAAAALGRTLRVEEGAGELAKTVRLEDSAREPAKTVRIEDGARELAKTVRIDEVGKAEAAPERRTELLAREGPVAGVAWLIAARGPRRGEVHQLRAERVTIGAAAECELVLGDAQVSARHAAIRLRESGFVLTDLDSTNGTFVNQQPVTQCILADGDEIRFGTSEWVFKCLVFEAH